MINVTKISNQDNGFLLSYYINGNNDVVICDAKNIVSELNAAFAAFKKYQEELIAKQAEREHFYGQGQLGAAMGSNISLIANSTIRKAD